MRILAFLLVGAWFLSAQIRVPIQKTVLANGLTVVVVHRPRAPVFSARIVFRTGSAQDPGGKSGMAHVVEHMLFKGTQSYGLRKREDAPREALLLTKQDDVWEAMLAEEAKVGAAAGKGLGISQDSGSPRLEALRQELLDLQREHQTLVEASAYASLYEAVGGTGINGSTGADYTLFQVDLPKNRFEFWCRMEADRWANPVFRGFHGERAVIQEERRTRYEDGSIGGDANLLQETLVGLAFQYHPYARLGIGAMSDLHHMRRAEAMAFFQRHYAPNRAALVLVGDVQLERCLPAIQAYFGAIPRQAELPDISSVEPPQLGERRAVVVKDRVPMVRVCWHVPPQGHPDVPALQVLSALLSKGRTSRLHKAAVEGKALTADFPTVYGVPGMRCPTLFEASASVKGDHAPEALESVLEGCLEALKQGPPSPQEMERVRRNAEMEVVSAMERNDTLADQLALNWAIAGDEGAFLADLERLKAVAPEDVQRVARTYFVPENRVVVTLKRPGRAH